jgi:beta-galactosidase/beta-glucuronidase
VTLPVAEPRATGAEGMRDHPLPQFARDAWASLDGAWQVQLEPDGEWREIRVPFTFEAPLSGIGAGDEVHERIRYRRTFRIPEGWRERTLIRFGGVDWRATVSVDGSDVGTHEGGYTHFSLDLGRLEPGSEHEVGVDVFDPADDAFGQAKGKQRAGGGIWYTRATGIWRSVWIEGVPDGYLEDIALDAEPGGTVRAAGQVVLEVEEPRLWSPTDPFLYDVELRRGDDVVHSYVGFRTIDARGRELLVNGRPLRLAGVLDQGFWPGGVYTAPTGDALRADVEAAKALGFNLARKHVKVEDPRWYAWCDRIGLLVAQDLPTSHDLSTNGAQERLRAEWAEVVAQLRTHPSVVMWILGNEDWGRPPKDFQRRLVCDTRRADATRLVVDASGWNQLEDTDLVDVHDYGSELTQPVGARDDIPLWLGECGGISLAVDGRPAGFSYRDAADARELAAGYRGVVRQIPREAAGFVWTQLADVEGELNGLLTADRVPKVPLDEIRIVNEDFLNA